MQVVLITKASSMPGSVLVRQALMVPSWVTKMNLGTRVPALLPLKLTAGPETWNSTGWPGRSLAALEPAR